MVWSLGIQFDLPSHWTAEVLLTTETILGRFEKNFKQHVLVN